MVWSLKSVNIIKSYFERLYCEFISRSVAAAHVWKSFLDMLKNQMWWNSSFEDFLRVDSYCDVFYIRYKSQETLSKLWLLWYIQIKHVGNISISILKYRI